MGTYNTVYIGPYIEVKSRMVEKKTAYMTHPVTGKRQRTMAPFCANTGVKFEPIEKMITERSFFDFYDFPEHLDEAVFFVPAYTENSDKTTTAILSLNPIKGGSELFNLNLAGVDTGILLEQFAMAHVDYLDFITESGFEWSTTWGVVYYAH